MSVLVILGAALAIYGLAEERDVIVLAGIPLGPERGPDSPIAVAKAEMRRDIEERVAEQMLRAHRERQAREN